MSLSVQSWLVTHLILPALVALARLGTRLDPEHTAFTLRLTAPDGTIVERGFAPDGVEFTVQSISWEEAERFEEQARQRQRALCVVADCGLPLQHGS